MWKTKKKKGTVTRLKKNGKGMSGVSCEKVISGNPIEEKWKGDVRDFM
ncbi:MAG: hypothetical protein K6G88_12190 [Lachnospiraceae bacterium]|nr:hypothetical protein [Lachnospiraceae bacterium]